MQGRIQRALFHPQGVVGDPLDVTAQGVPVQRSLAFEAAEDQQRERALEDVGLVAHGSY